MPLEPRNYDAAVAALGDFLRWLCEPPKNSQPLLTLGRRTVCVSFLIGAQKLAGMNQAQLCRKYGISRRLFSTVRTDFLNRFGVNGGGK